MTAVPHPLAPEQRAISLPDLLALVASLALVAAPHALRAPWWLTLATAGCVAWRGLVLTRGLPLPSPWMLALIAAGAMGGVWLEYRVLFGRAPGIVLLMLFAGLKMLEMRTHRDATVLAFLCYFLIITNFLYTQSIPTALLMAAALAQITLTLVRFAAPQRAGRANLRTVVMLFAHAAPIALVLFMLFPRVQGPLWAMPQDINAGVTGLAESMSPGNLSKLAQSDTIAFRAEFSGRLPPPRQRYWRGPVMWDFDGRTWRIIGPFVQPFEPPLGGTLRYRYTVLLEPHERNWLFALESVATLPERSRITFDGQLISYAQVRTRLRYELESVADPDPAPEASERALRRALQLPEGYNPKSVALARQWRSGGASDALVLDRAVDFFRGAKLAYTLEPPLLGRDSIDEFLFEARAGFCEHFSSAFVFMLRAAGVPARVVTGYQGGDENPIDRNITVRQSDAHAWAEVHLPQRGWVRVDPTAAAVPGRVESGLARAMPEGEPLPFMMRPQMQWLRTLRYNWEAAAHKWNIWVLGYNPERQREFLSLFGMRNVDWRELTALLFTILGGITVVLVLWSFRRLARPDPVQRAWTAFCAKLGKQGVARSPHEGPRDYTQRAAARLPAAAAAIGAIGELYIALRYGAGAARERIDELKRRVRDLKLA